MLPLAEGLYMHISWTESEQYSRFSSNGVLYLQNGQALMVDTPMDVEVTKSLVNYIQDSLDATIKMAIPGHGPLGDKTLLQHTAELAEAHLYN